MKRKERGVRWRVAVEGSGRMPSLVAIGEKRAIARNQKPFLLSRIACSPLHFPFTAERSFHRRFENILLFSHSFKPCSLVYPAPSNHADCRCLVPLCNPPLP